MDVSRTARIATGGLILATMSPLCCAQANRSSYDPASQQHSRQQKDGFVDFTLKRINPSDKDYGQSIDDGRKLLLQESIENSYFWSNVFALGVLGCLFVVIVYQQKLLNKREWTTSEALGEFEHALGRANAQVEEVTKRNHGLMEALTALRESALQSPTLASDLPDPSRTPALRSRPASAPSVPTEPAKDTPAKPANPSTRKSATVGQSSNQIALFKPGVDLVMKVNSLEQQLGRSQDEAGVLRRQLNEANRRAEVEQQKNRALKGE
jgi:hypothetical protein